MQKTTAFILLAGGQGSRLQNDTPKQFIRVAGKSILEHSFNCLADCDQSARIIVVVPADAQNLAKNLLAQYPRAEVIVGGNSRQGSTYAALKYLKASPPQSVIIHDAARPFLSNQIVFDVIAALQTYEAVDVAIPTTDTIIVERDGFIQSIPKRNHIYRGQTPQGFHYGPLLNAYMEIGDSRLTEFTDDCGIYMECNPMSKVRIVKGNSENIKITENLDLVLADELFRIRYGQWLPEKQGLDVRNKKAIIFGGSKGIGHAMVQVLQEAGCQVQIASRSNGCDISSHDQVKNFIEKASDLMQGLDFVVNTVGLLSKANLHEQAMSDIEKLITVNFLGAIHVAHAAYPFLVKNKGMLLNFSSSSYTRGRASYTPYSASKAAIVNLTQGLADEWSQNGVRVNCIVPGRTDTEMRRANFNGEATKTLLNPYEVALSACKLMSSDMTGVVIRV